MAFPPSIDLTTLGAFTSIVFISLTLSGDNALVIGMATARLPRRQRRWALVGAVGAAIVIRVFFAGLFAALLYRTDLAGVRVVGGLVLVWIAWKLVVDPPHGPTDDTAETEGLLEAIGLIIVADVSMSLDNMLAVASASNGHLWLIAAGLLVSIPLLFVGAALIARFIERYPQIVWLGGALIGWVAGQLVAEEPLLHGLFGFPHAPAVVGGVAVLVVLGAAFVRTNGPDAVAG